MEASVQPLFGAVALLLFVSGTNAEDGERTRKCVRTHKHACAHLCLKKEQTLSLSSLTAWLLILLPKYHKTGYNIYNYPHLH